MKRQGAASYYELMTTSDDLRRATVDWLGAMHMRMAAARPGDTWFALTFHPCLGKADDVEPEIRLRLWDGCVAQALFGGAWRNGPARRLRPWGVLVGQPGVEGFHFHGLLAVPNVQLGRFLSVADQALSKLAPFGSIKLKHLGTDKIWLKYSTRHLRLTQPVNFVALPYVQNPRDLPFAAASSPRTPPHRPHIPLAA